MVYQVKSVVFRVLLIFLFILIIQVSANQDNFEVSNIVINLTNKSPQSLKSVVDVKLENNAQTYKVDVLGGILKTSIRDIKLEGRKVDLVFLIDSSSSVGQYNFLNEIKFVKKLLGDFIVSVDKTRIAVVTYSSENRVVRQVDQISTPNSYNDKCILLNYELPGIKYTEGGTYTIGAFLEAKKIFKMSRKGVKKVLFLITDGFSNGGDPTAVAQELKTSGVTIFTIGIQNGNYEELYNISTPPGDMHSFILDSFQQFESLARRALHIDLRAGQSIPVSNTSLCDILCSRNKSNTDFSMAETCCDKNAVCSCGTSSGHYMCLCAPGYYGSGLVNSCTQCPNGTYSDGWNLCRPCPDINHITISHPATDKSNCTCKAGFRSIGTNCEVITCPILKAPQNGYFVKHTTSCSHVLHAACGVRCQSGYQLTGSSIRLCQHNETWSGTEAQCLVKTCPPLEIPSQGSIKCTNEDLGLTFDIFDQAGNKTRTEINSEDRLFTKEMPIDTECTFKCIKGYFLVGSKRRNCLPLSKWDGLYASCKPILCTSLPELFFGSYVPELCYKMKVSHGTTCNATCLPGFTMKGPLLRLCGGRKTGQWSERGRATKCIDHQAPSLTCPSDVIIPTEPLQNYAVVKSFPACNATDNSGLNLTVWTKPSINATVGLKVYIGNTSIIYVVMDAFSNRAKCNFTIIVKDIEPPTIEHCLDPPPFLTENATGAFVKWEEPIFYDNSKLAVEVKRSRQFGMLSIGKHKVLYTASDIFNNTNTCTLNIAVKAMECDELASENSLIQCNKLPSNVTCVVTCIDGYGFAIGNDDGSVSSQFSCQSPELVWKTDNSATNPDCSLTEIPNSIEDDGIVSLESGRLICNDTKAVIQIQNQIYNSIEQSLKTFCRGDLICELKPSLLSCDDDKEISDLEEKTNQINRRKRNTMNIKNKKKSHKRIRQKLNIKFKIVGKLIKNQVLNKNSIYNKTTIYKIKEKILQINLLKRQNESFNKLLADLEIELINLHLNESIICKIGSIAKKLTCVQCPSGTFHNVSFGYCQSCPIDSFSNTSGASICHHCPLNTSTRKIHSKNVSDCKGHCSPGTYARQKKKSKHSTEIYTSLMPFCSLCPINDYQPLYNQINCIHCPSGFITISRGSKNESDCVPVEGSVNSCDSEPNPCGGNGQCIPSRNGTAYSCTCNDGYAGSNCELQTNPCLRSPCHNNGICRISYDNSSIKYICECQPGFGGHHCEYLDDICKVSEVICVNYGTCVILNDEPVCQCRPGYEGVFCDISIAMCSDAPCGLQGQCHETENGYHCVCNPGYMGKRCHIQPCDYLPCKSNSYCENIEETNTTKQSYECKCMDGFEGYNCSDKHDPCKDNPCGTFGTCSSKEFSKTDVSEDELQNFFENSTEIIKYVCKCNNLYYGKNCNEKDDPEFILHFSKSGITDFIQTDGPTQDMHNISMCVWLQSQDTFNYGTIFSYATIESDNTFTVTDYNGFVLYVNGNHVITDVYANDGYWHFLCVTWSQQNGTYQIFLDGILRQNGTNLSDGTIIKGNGTLIIGQEQDSVGSSFSESESFLGKLYKLDVWHEVLTTDDIINNMQNCNSYNGNLYAWVDFKHRLNGDVKVERSTFCNNCPILETPEHGILTKVGNVVTYSCLEGFVLSLGGQKYDNRFRRRCLKTSQWEFNEDPICQKQECGFPGYLPNGHVLGTSYFYNDSVTFECFEGFTLHGERNTVCLYNGSWSSQQPLCKGIQCPYIQAPNNGIVSYMTEYAIDLKDIYLPAGTQAEFNCSGDLIGESILTCQDDGVWDFETPECKQTETYCGTEGIPATPINGYIVDNKERFHLGSIELQSFKDKNVTRAQVGAKVQYRCRNGHTVLGQDYTECLSNGSWSYVENKCKPIKCGPPPKFSLMTISLPADGFVGDLTKQVPYHFGNMLTFQCIEGYEGYGKKIVRCQANGQWSKITVRCSRVSCNKPVIPLNAKIFGDSYLYQDKVSVQCPEESTSVTASLKIYQLTCISNGTWQPQSISC